MTAELERRWARADAASRALVQTRLHQLLDALDLPRADGLAALDAALDGAAVDRWWLALSVLGARLPDHAEVLRTRRRGELDGPSAALGDACLEALLGGGGPRNAAGDRPAVRVLRGAVLLDVADTALSPYATGVQRVVREVARRWAGRDEVLLTGWDDALPALRVLSAPERARVLDGSLPPVDRVAADEVLVPWRSTVVVPEVRAERARADAYQALFRHSGNRSGIVGHDCVPVSMAETVASAEMANGFVHHLAAAAHATVVATTSAGSAAEFEGWRTMLAGAGLRGPRLEVVRLAAQAPPTVPDEVRESVRFRCTLSGQPLVLVVGSNEPRKNHATVLHAAELLWRQGVRFSLTFIGGNAWGGGAFTDRFTALVAAGRPLTALDKATDAELWAAYELARCTVFPSLGEGFGLPIVESLAVGTPVVTSGYGSMREVVELGGGGVLVDPRDAHDVARGVRQLVEDDALHADLAAAARSRPPWTWDDHGARLWDVLVAGSGEQTVR